MGLLTQEVVYSGKPVIDYDEINRIPSGIVLRIPNAVRKLRRGKETNSILMKQTRLMLEGF